MQFNNEFMQALEDNICKLNTEDIFQDDEKINRLEKLLAIKAYIGNIEMLALQEKVLKQSETVLQNTDFGKLDFNAVLEQLMEKR